MAQITAALVKELRDKAGAGMMDCKKALSENDGDIEAAIDWLRQKGISKAEKKSGRVAAEGLVAVASNGTTAVAVEVNSETDFVARNEQFQSLVKGVADAALANDGDYDATKSSTYGGASHSVEAEVTEAVGTIGENMTFRRSNGLTVSSGVVSTYIHNSVAPGLGKLAVLVALESSADAGVLEALGKQLAMHVAATNPQAMTVDEMSAEDVEREKTVLVEQARESGKPDNIIEKMIVGRMNKFYQEVVFVEQTFVIDGENKVSKVIENAAKDAGTEIKLTGYVRLELGEGIEKEEEDFAAEVAAMSS
ncbi:MAG: elongation factor Ts [Kordiimonadaceae bacterium]|nr:elongation factor Ts [Kordiimonadaceae bacterium]MBT6035386.1 elongation factor Ts [Kordiimonadaceae bacterium]MBT6330240.1 elongation factor Ts [Kordiimonadaceae bacterium]MBT7582266.1 elongation factor Ts [Kordiimonadaceae bacterium]